MLKPRARFAWPESVDNGFRQLEHAAYLLLGVLLAIASILALLNAGGSLWNALRDLAPTTEIVDAVDKLLFVFMLIEILHTVRASLSRGGLTCEPFLVVGLIASIRRVLVITLQTSQEAKPQNWSPQSQMMIRSSMLELGVTAGLILSMVVSIYLLHRARPDSEEPVGSSI